MEAASHRDAARIGLLLGDRVAAGLIAEQTEAIHEDFGAASITFRAIRLVRRSRHGSSICGLGHRGRVCGLSHRRIALLCHRWSLSFVRFGRHGGILSGNAHGHHRH